MNKKISVANFYKDYFSSSIKNNNIARLNFMEAPFPANLLTSITKDIDESVFSMYPDPNYPVLTAQISKEYGFSSEIGILMGNGSFDVIQQLFFAMKNKSNKVGLFIPTFFYFRYLANQLNFNLITFEFSNNHQLDHKHVLAKIRNEKPGLILIVSPNNPTGHVFDKKLMQKIIELNIGIVVIDQIYSAYAEISYLDFLNRYSHVVLINSLSKIGFAGLRFGFLAYHKKEMGDFFSQFERPFQIGAITALFANKIYENMDIIKKQIALTIKERERLFHLLQKIDVIIVEPSKTNFINFSLKNPEKNIMLHEKLFQNGLLLFLYPSQSSHYANYLRLTVSNREINDTFIYHLNQLLNDLK